MRLRKVYATLLALIAFAALSALLSIWINSQNERLKSLQDLAATLHKMRFLLASSSEALGNAVLSKSDANAEKFGRDALRKVEEFKEARQQVEKSVQGATELKLLQEIDIAFAKFEKVCDSLAKSSKENSNRKAYSLAVGPSLDLVNKIDGEFAQLLQTKGDVPDESQHLWGIEVYEARLALLRIQSILVRHIFEATDGVMDMLESELRSELDRIKSSLSSAHLAPNNDEDQKIAEINSQLKEFEKIIAEITILSRQNSNINAEEIVMNARLEATLDCEEKLNAFEKMLHEQIESMLPKGRGKGRFSSR